MFHVIACHKLLELMGKGGPLSLFRVALQGSDHFFASLVVKVADFKVAGIAIYCEEVVSVFKMEDTASNCFRWTVWNFVTDKWFLLLIFLVRSTHATLYYVHVVLKVSIHARPKNCMSKAPFNSCEGTMELFDILGLRLVEITHLKPLKKIPSCAVSLSLTVK